MAHQLTLPQKSFLRLVGIQCRYIIYFLISHFAHTNIYDDQFIGYGLEVDMWAVGVITYILLCGFPPFRSPDRKQTELFEFIKAGKYEFLSPYWDSTSAGLYIAC